MLGFTGERNDNYMLIVFLLLSALLARGEEWIFTLTGNKGAIETLNTIGDGIWDFICDIYDGMTGVKKFEAKYFKPWEEDYELTWACLKPQNLFSPRFEAFMKIPTILGFYLLLTYLPIIFQHFGYLGGLLCIPAMLVILFTVLRLLELWCKYAIEFDK